MDSDCIINLSSISLTHIESQVLCKGLSFIPKPKHINLLDLYRDTNKFVSSMRYKNEHHGQTVKAKPRFQRRSYYRAPPTSSLDLENAIEKLKLDLVDIAYEQNKDDNLTRAERKALTTLKARDDSD